MTIMRMEQIYFFQEVAATHSITLAAKNLLISQQGLSESISKLEEEFGIQLFYRTKKGVTLTADGEQFLQVSSRMINNYQEMLNIVKKSQQQHKALCIAADSNIIEGHFEDLLRIYKHHVSSLQLNMHETVNTKTVIEMVLKREADFGLSLCEEQYYRNLKRHWQSVLSEIDFIKIHESALYVLVNYASEFAQKEMLDMSEVLSSSLVFSNDHLCQSIQHAYPQRTLNIFLVTSNQNIIVQAILNHNAVGFCTSYSKYYYENILGIKPIRIAESLLHTMAIVPKRIAQKEQMKLFLSTFSHFLSTREV